jgi:PRTRC genetic system protein E
MSDQQIQDDEPLDNELEEDTDAAADETDSENDDCAVASTDSLQASVVPAIIPQAQPGLIRGLAKGLAINGTLLLAIAKMSETELLVTIQPPAGNKAFGGAALPLQVSGSPEEIDAEMLEALAHYAPAREFVASVAKDVAERSAAAAQRTQDEAEKKRVATPASTPKPKSEKLLVTVKPPGAVLIVVNASNAAQNVEIGKRATLPVGKYTITATFAGYETHTASLNLAKAEKIDIVLKQPEPWLLAGLEVAK